MQEILTASLKPKSRAKWVADFAKNKILQRLNALRKGTLVLKDGSENHTFGRKYSFGTSYEISATITVHDPRFDGEIAFGVSIGAGEAYMLG